MIFRSAQCAWVNLTKRPRGAALATEYALLRCGARLPIGGTRLVVAIKDA